MSHQVTIKNWSQNPSSKHQNLAGIYWWQSPNCGTIGCDPYPYNIHINREPRSLVSLQHQSLTFHWTPKLDSTLYTNENTHLWVYCCPNYLIQNPRNSLLCCFPLRMPGRKIWGHILILTVYYCCVYSVVFIVVLRIYTYIYIHTCIHAYIIMNMNGNSISIHTCHIYIYIYNIHYTF